MLWIHFFSKLFTSMIQISASKSKTWSLWSQQSHNRSRSERSMRSEGSSVGSAARDTICSHCCGWRWQRSMPMITTSLVVLNLQGSRGPIDGGLLKLSKRKFLEVAKLLQSRLAFIKPSTSHLWIPWNCIATHAVYEKDFLTIIYSTIAQYCSPPWYLN